jgi:hypothetical protein
MADSVLRRLFEGSFFSTTRFRTLGRANFSRQFAAATLSCLEAAVAAAIARASSTSESSSIAAFLSLNETLGDGDRERERFEGFEGSSLTAFNERDEVSQELKSKAESN